MNFKFLALEFIGIILIVVGHKGGINLFEEWFPLYSFHLPLFIFISGYFFKKNMPFKEFLLKKVKRLLVPYFIWNLVYCLICTFLRYTKIISYGSNISFDSLFISPWITGHQTGLNVASWFVLSLFLTSVFYFIIKKILEYIRVENEYIITAVFLIISIFGIGLSMNGYNQGFLIPATRVMFYMLFYQLGYLYKHKLESHDNLNSFLYFSILFFIQFIIIYTFKVLTYSNVSMTFGNNVIYLSIITSITGIMFWLRIAKIIEPFVKESKIAQYIGANTWTIMMHHQFVFFLINFFILFLSKSLNVFGGFDKQLFNSNMWYTYIPKGVYNFALFYVILGVAVPLIFKYFFEKKIKIRNEKIKK